VGDAKSDGELTRAVFFATGVWWKMREWIKKREDEKKRVKINGWKRDF